MSASVTDAITSSNSYCAQSATTFSTLRSESRRTFAFPRETHSTGCPKRSMNLSMVSMVARSSEDRLTAVEGLGERILCHAFHPSDAGHGLEQIGAEPLPSCLGTEVPE